jgi:uncharacterized protein (TIGR00725 family)
LIGGDSSARRSEDNGEMSAPYVAVVGAGIARPEVERSAERVGRAIAERGGVVVCGGMTGVMEAACRGAKSAGGTTVGILPGPRRSDANEWVDIAIPTDLGEMRNALIIRAVDVVVAIAGEFGTLSEIALALKIGKPVVGLETWELGKAGAAVSAYPVAETPEDAVERAFELI